MNINCSKDMICSVNKLQFKLLLMWARYDFILPVCGGIQFMAQQTHLFYVCIYLTSLNSHKHYSFLSGFRSLSRMVRCQFFCSDFWIHFAIVNEICTHSLDSNEINSIIWAKRSCPQVCVLLNPWKSMGNSIQFY